MSCLFDVLTALLMYLSPWLHLTWGCWEVQYHCSLLTMSASAHKLLSCCQTHHPINLWHPTHSFSSSYSSTFPVPLKDLPPLLIMGVERERQHDRRYVEGGEQPAGVSSLPPLRGPRTAKQAILPTELPLFMFLCSKISLVGPPHFQLNTSNLSPSLLKRFLKVFKPLAPLTSWVVISSPYSAFQICFFQVNPCLFLYLN